MSNRVNIALVLIVFCIILILATIIVAAIKIDLLSRELDFLKSNSRNADSNFIPPVAVAQQLNATTEASTNSSYK